MVKTYKFDGEYQSINLDGPDHQKYLLTQNAMVNGTVTDPGTISVTFAVDGKIEGGAGLALESSGSYFSFIVNDTGWIHANVSVADFTGDHATVANFGTIAGAKGNGTLIQSSGDHLSLTNHGIMESDDGVVAVIGGDHNFIRNMSDGTMKGLGGVSFQNHNTDFCRLINDGRIISTTTAAAVGGSDGDDKIVNHGVIKGNIWLGDGGDTLDTRGGTLIGGTVEGGFNNDTLITDNAKYFLAEYDGGGEDTIKSTVSYKMNSDYEVENLYLIGKKDINASGGILGERILGNSGNNRIHGNGGDDLIRGDGGDDRMWGGEGSDTYILNTGSGHDVIVDFDPTQDIIAIGPWNAMTSYEKLLNHSSFRGGNMTISAGSDQIILVGIDRDHITEAAFDFLT